MTPWHFIDGTGYTYGRSGENLARRFDSDKVTVAAWMKSPTHRADVLGDWDDQDTCKRGEVMVSHFGKRGDA